MKTTLTKKRQQILDTLKDSHEALSAKEIHTLLPGVDLVTVYRALEFLTKKKMITALSFDTETKYEFQDSPHYHAVCNDCSKVIHFNAPNAQLKKLLKLKDFDIEQVEVTVRGSCTNTHKK